MATTSWTTLLLQSLILGKLRNRHVYCIPQSILKAEKDRAEFDGEWKELGKLIAQDRKLRETLRQRQLERSRDLRWARCWNLVRVATRTARDDDE